MLYQVYEGVTCPVCGSTDTADCGPYEVIMPASTADHGCPEVHYMSCRNCGDSFDAGPRRVAAKWQAMLDASLPWPNLPIPRRPHLRVVP